MRSLPMAALRQPVITCITAGLRSRYGAVLETYAGELSSTSGL